MQVGRYSLQAQLWLFALILIASSKVNAATCEILPHENQCQGSNYWPIPDGWAPDNDGDCQPETPVLYSPKFGSSLGTYPDNISFYPLQDAESGANKICDLLTTEWNDLAHGIPYFTWNKYSAWILNSAYYHMNGSGSAESGIPEFQGYKGAGWFRSVSCDYTWWRASDFWCDSVGGCPGTRFEGEPYTCKKLEWCFKVAPEPDTRGAGSIYAYCPDGYRGFEGYIFKGTQDKCVLFDRTLAKKPVADGKCPARRLTDGSLEKDWLDPDCADAVCPLKDAGPPPCDLKAGNPIHIGIGNKYQSETDYPGSPSFVRHYNHLIAVKDGYFDGHWHSRYQASILHFPAGNRVEVLRPDGKRLNFTQTANGWASDADIDDRLEQTPGGWRYTVAATDDLETYANGQLIAITDRTGLTQTLTYDTGGKLATVTDGLGRMLTFTYDATGRLDTLIDPAGGIYRYTYADDKLVSVSYPDGAIRIYLFEDIRFPHALTGLIDENGQRYATWAYDDHVRAILSEHAGGANRVDLSYGTGNTVATDSLGNNRTHGLTTVLGVTRSTGVSQPGGSGCGPASSSITYDVNGNVASRTDFNGHTTRYAYDLARNLETSRTEAYGTPEARTIATEWHSTLRVPVRTIEPSLETTIAYDDQGNVTQKTLRDLQANTTRTWTWTYVYSPSVPGVIERKIEDGPRTDAADLTTWDYWPATATCPGALEGTGRDKGCRGQLMRTTDALGHVTEYRRYNAHGQPEEIVDPNGLVTKMTYDARQHLLAIDVGGELTAYAYDPAGQLTRATTPGGSYIAYAYDGAHRLVEVSDDQGNRIAYTLDAAGNRTKEDTYDPQGQLARTRARAYDALNRLQLDLGATPGRVTQYEYDAQGNPTRTLAPHGRTTQQSHDALNRPAVLLDPMGGYTAYAYDGRDQVTQVTDPKQLATGYVRNGFGDITQTDSPDTGLTHIVYDAAGNPVSRTDARGKTATTAYDALNRPTQVAYGDGARVYDWDACANGLGRLCGFTDPAGETRYDYDFRGRVTRKTQTVDGRTLTVAYAYDAAGRLTGLTLPSGRTAAYRHAGSRIVGIALDGQALIDHADYEPFGPITGWTWGNGQTSQRAYDLDGRPLQIDNLPTLPSDLSWDAADRITAIQDGQRLPDQFGYDKLDRLVAADGDWGNQGFDYDSVGNRTLKTDGATSTQYLYGAADHHLTSEIGPISRNYQYDAAGNLIHDGTFAYAYDDAGRLNQVTQGGAAVATYRHNALGQRVRKTTAAGTTDFVYDESGHLIGEYDTQGQARREYLWLDDLPVAVLTRSGPGTTTEQVLDNTGATYVGAWPTSTSVAGYLGANYQTHVANGAPVGAITVDNGQAVYAGAWPTSTAVAGFEGAHYQSHAPNGPPPEALIQDNTQATYVGTWPTSTSVAGYQGTNYQTHAAGTGQSSATWSFNLATPGPYEVHARWTAHANRATNASYAIAHADGTAIATVNQRLNGGQWNNLGTFNFATAASVTLTDQADGYVIADAIMLVPVGAGPNSATWTLPVATPGEYEVQVKWTAHANRATNAQYTIGHANGTATMTANQQTNGGIWNSLGTYRFNDSATVKLTDQADGYVIADAIRLVPTGAQPNSATWSFATVPGEYEIQARWTAHPNRATNAQYAIAHAGGTSTVNANQQLNGGTWNSLGSYTFGPTATITLTDQANGYVIADAVKLIHTTPATAGIYYVHADHLGTPRKITRPNDSQVIWSWNGASFGETPANEDPDGDGARFEFNPRFPGQYFDAETGKHYNYFRDYDPRTGRYIESDPIGLKGGINTYSYVGNDPINQVDPLGLANSGPWPRHPITPNSKGPFGPFCGPEGSTQATWIPDLNVQACKEHDKCYDDCARRCEGQFCKYRCDVVLDMSIPGYGVATYFGGDSIYEDLKKKHNCKCE